MPEPVLNDICLELVPLVAGLSIAKAGGSGPPGHLGRVGVGCPRLLRQFMAQPTSWTSIILVRAQSLPMCLILNMSSYQAIHAYSLYAYIIEVHLRKAGLKCPHMTLTIRASISVTRMPLRRADGFWQSIAWTLSASNEGSQSESSSFLLIRNSY